MLSKLLTQVGLWAVAYCVLITIFLMPTSVNYQPSEVRGHFAGATYDYSFEEHWELMKSFGAYLIENKGFGYEENGDSILGFMLEKIGRSVLLIIPAIFISFFFGIMKGIFDYRTRNSLGKLPGKSMTWLSLSVPDMFFVLLIQLTLLFVVYKGWLFHIDLFGSDKLENVLLCILFLSIYPTAYIANITFQSLRDEEGLDYIRTAKSKGLNDFHVFYKHMLKNGFLKILAHANSMVLYLLSNLFIIEFFMEYRGAAYYFKGALGQPNVFMVGQNVSSIDIVYAAGYAFFFTVVILISNVIAEIAKNFVSPMNGGEA
ncbi:ABC transporter permease subunit [Chungangia koreensis]|uniref:ABC transporter permease subunit n=1 Tax=Chungangia koreensis TaxID=752657 RepID=A0ABV8X5G7_9LACT